MGKVLLAWADADTRRRLCNRKLERFTSNTITAPGELRRALEQVREKGFAIDSEEITRGLVCVAAPVFGADGAVAAAMSCTFPSYVREDRSIRREIDAVCRQSRLASAGPSGPR